MKAFLTEENFHLLLAELTDAKQTRDLLADECKRLNGELERVRSDRVKERSELTTLLRETREGISSALLLDEQLAKAWDDLWKLCERIDAALGEVGSSEPNKTRGK